LLQRVDVILSVSEEDAAFTRARLPNPATKVWVVPNGVEIGSFVPNRPLPENRIIFCGAMDILMNIDAVVRFARRVFPEVREIVPDAEFWIVGRNPDDKVRALDSIPGVKVTGQVADVRPYYAKSKVAVAPFRYGGGTKLKVLEAMALGVPVVATPIGCQGIKCVSGKHLLVEEAEEEFALSVVNLLNDDVLWKSIVVEARRLVEQRYSWEKILEKVIHQLEMW